MKLKSLILGSVAAAGLSTAGFAADLGVLTSLDVCDSLGISGLTISSSDNCLAISGGVTYEFNWGDYNGVAWAVETNDGDVDVIDNDSTVDGDNDWKSDVDAWLQFVGTSSSDFGPASATIKLDVTGDPQIEVENEVVVEDRGYEVLLDSAYVSVGDTTTIMAGLKSSIANFGDDEPMNFLGLFNSEAVDKGVMFIPDQPQEGGVSIQVVSQVADGVTIKAGLENLDDDVVDDAGTAVGVIEYAGNGIKAHVTGLVGGILDGDIDDWAVHAGFTGTFDAFTVLGAAAYGYDVDTTDAYWNVLGSAKANLDIFEIAISAEATGGDAVAEQVGFGGSVGATVTEGVKLNLGARWFDENTDTDDNETIQIAAQIVAAVSETVTLTGEVGYFATNKVAATPDTDLYGSAELAWAPGGGFTSSIKGQMHSTGAYKVTFKAAKEFK